MRPGCFWRILTIGMVSLFFGINSSSAALVGTEVKGSELIWPPEIYSQDYTQNAFGQPLPLATREQKREFSTGNSFFRLPWVTAPSSTEVRDGLGPTYNAVSCGSCHVFDGRAPAFVNGKLQPSLLVRISHFEETATGQSWKFDARYGDQINPNGILGVNGEADVVRSIKTYLEKLDDGTIVTMNQPVDFITNLSYGPLHPNTKTSSRIAPQLVGLGLLEAVDESQILEREDQEDRNSDGISGRAQKTWDIRKGRFVLGRFGWKAGQPSLEQQNAGAFLGDMGLTSELFPQANCPIPQVECRNQISGGDPEVEAHVLARVTTYVQMLAPPRPRFDNIESFKMGLQTFKRIGCESCHRERFETKGHALDSLNGHAIYPFTDLLLHDMGQRLEDQRPEHGANGREWRTPPLWGIGLIPRVNGQWSLMHDGRATSIEEAILWHGGEAQRSQLLFRRLSTAERKLLVDFVKAL